MLSNLLSTLIVVRDCLTFKFGLNTCRRTDSKVNVRLVGNLRGVRLVTYKLH